MMHQAIDLESQIIELTKELHSYLTTIETNPAAEAEAEKAMDKLMRLVGKLKQEDGINPIFH